MFKTPLPCIRWLRHPGEITATPGSFFLFSCTLCRNRTPARHQLAAVVPAGCGHRFQSMSYSAVSFLPATLRSDRALPAPASPQPSMSDPRRPAGQYPRSAIGDLLIQSTHSGLQLRSSSATVIDASSTQGCQGSDARRDGYGGAAPAIFSSVYSARAS